EVTEGPIKKANLLIEISDTGIGIGPEFMQHVWESFSQGDKSINRKQQGTGLGLLICKKLVEINGGEIKAESQLEKGSKFWFTWNVELLLPEISEFQNASIKILFDEQISYVLPYAVRLNRLLIVHPVKSVRNAMVKFLEKSEKVDAFDTFDKAIQEAKSYKQLYKRTYDVVFISLYEKNENEVIKAVSELKEVEKNNLSIILISFPSNTGKALAEKLVRKIGGQATIIYTPITWNKLVNQFSHIMNNKVFDSNRNIENLSVSNHNDNNTNKEVADYGQDNHERITSEN
ncbi:12421_t:CDS:2, partial [Racocetra persica]